MKKLVVIGFLGTQLDAGLSPVRWEKWRPTVSLAQHDDLVVDRLELFHDVRSSTLAKQVQSDYAQLSPTTEVRLVEMNLVNPWDFGEVYSALYDWSASYPFDTATEDYQAHITTGTSTKGSDLKTLGGNPEAIEAFLAAQTVATPEEVAARGGD